MRPASGDGEAGVRMMQVVAAGRGGRAGALAAIALAAVASTALLPAAETAYAAGPDLIFRESTKFHFVTPNDKLATYAIDDPMVEGVACYYTVPEKGGIKGTLGLAEETSDVSLACRQYGAIKFKGGFAQGDTVFEQRRSLLFKHMQIVRGCDPARNVLVYMVYSDKLIEGSPKNSTSSVAIQPWGATTDVARCADAVKK